MLASLHHTRILNSNSKLSRIAIRCAVASYHDIPLVTTSQVRLIASSTSNSSSILSPSSTASAVVTQHHAPPVINFEDSASAHGSKSTFELVRAITVFKLCRLPFLVKHAEGLLDLSTKILGSTITNSVVKHTFFKHFCAGEDSVDMKPVIDMLQEHNIGPILDYAAESEDSSDDSGDGIEGKKLQVQYQVQQLVSYFPPISKSFICLIQQHDRNIYTATIQSTCKSL